MTASRHRSRHLVVSALLASAGLVGGTAFAPTASAAPTQEVPAPVAEPTGPVTLFYLPLSGDTLKRGSQNREVFLMQITLVARGYWLEAFPGDYNASTMHAVTAFQKYMGLPRNGTLDPLTRFVLGGTLDRPLALLPQMGPGAEVDLGRQVLISQQNGIVRWVFNISSGSSRTPTPRGNFRVSRQINGLRISSLGKLWRPKYFNGGIAIHGSSSIPNYPASHGCVRLPDPSINFIWDADLVPVGTPLSVY